MMVENMFCTKCGKEITENGRFCQFCSAPLEQFSKIVPIWKFIFLSVITAGIYESYWFYKTWEFLREKDKLDISPFWRAVFSPIFAVSNAEHVLKLANRENYPEKYSPTIIGISFFILNALWRLPDPYWLISYFTFLPMIPIVKAMNFYWQKENPYSPLKNFSWWQIILIIFGGILLILVLIGVFIPE